MKRKVTFKEFLTVLGLGIWQALCFIGRVFNYKNKTPFWRILWSVVAVCLLIITFNICYVVWEDNNERETSNQYLSYESNSEISPNIYFHENGDGTGYTYNINDGTAILDGINWIATSTDNDSLAVFAKEEKRGYFNIYTGQEVIPHIYQKAWIFSEGIAAVLENDSLYFIDHQGKRITNRGFEYYYQYDGICFHNGYCVVKIKDKFGIIDKQGNWALNPEFDAVIMEGRNYWSVCKDNCWGVYNDSAKLVFPCKYKLTSISEECGIFLSMQDHTCKRYDYDGTLLDDFVVCGIEILTYSNGEMIDGDNMWKNSLCLKYEVPGSYYGLLSKTGKRLTPPIYGGIEAVAEDVFYCTYEENYYRDNGVLLNSKGEVINK